AAKKFEDAVRKIESDTEAQRALNDYNRHVHKVAEKEAQGQPIEVEDKRQLERLQQAVVTNPTLRDFQVAQMDYLDLMRRGDEARTGASMGPAAGAEAPGTPGAAGIISPQMVGGAPPPPKMS